MRDAIFMCVYAYRYVDIISNVAMNTKTQKLKQVK